ncbi:MAG: cellulase family glycosylhydrolase [Verrucomicrobia bacterium]|nr:cellulase family glycosylhydrolase [Verrucomicrobiota bacterium]
MRSLLVAVACWAIAIPAFGASADRSIKMDNHGVLRWQDDGGEVALFGANYYTPCQWNYRDIKALGLSHEKVIEQDVAHFARLGLDVLRLHVFDREISDRDGNLLDNDHVRLLDWLIAKAKERGIYTVLTPIAWWGVPGESPGFSTFFTMQQMTTDPTARKPQQNYLAQFVRHVNRFTGLAYKDDPAIICFELINEPLYPQGTTDAQVTDYINVLADAVRGTGCRKPIFYNGWQNRLAAVRDARVEGSTFGWYPTGLVAGRALRQNCLPRVDVYGGNAWTPTMRSEAVARKAKIVYEFDAADIGGSYMYPAMARAFRSGGAQIATQFQYDPLPVAPFNAGWQTHYLNLVFAPQKAVSFAIAAEAFRRLPRLQDYGRYPENTRFGPFRVSYEEDLSEMVTEREFFYSNDTRTQPPAPEKLERIVGCGSSPVVRYDGTGAYFLDMVTNGVWRLEVYPDAVWVNDPFGKDSLEREVSRVYWRERTMEIRLPDLHAKFRARPGVYMVKRTGAVKAADQRDFIAPPEKEQPPAIWHEPPREWVEGKPLPVAFTVATTEEPQKVVLNFNGPGVEHRLPLKSEKAYRYVGTIPAEWLKPGKACYRLASPAIGMTWELPVMMHDAPAVLFEADRHRVRVHGGVPHKQQQVEGMVKGRRALRIAVEKFGPPPSAVSFRNDVTEELEVRRDDLVGRKTLCVRARALEPVTTAVEVVVIERDGAPWGANVSLATEWKEMRIPLASLRYFDHWGQVAAGRGGKDDRLHPENLAAVNVCFGAWLYGQTAGARHTVEIESVTVE